MATDTPPVTDDEPGGRFSRFSDRQVELGKAVGFHAILWSLIGTVLFPVLWMVVVSVNQTAFEPLVADPLGWASNANLSGYRDVWYESDFPTGFETASSSASARRF